MLTLLLSVVMAMSQQPTPPVNKYTGSYTEDADGDGIRMNAFGHGDADVAFGPLSANRRFPGTADLAVLGTLVFAGPTRESIDVMVPDCFLPPARGTVRIDLRHHVSLPWNRRSTCRTGYRRPSWRKPCALHPSPRRSVSNDRPTGRN